MEIKFEEICFWDDTIIIILEGGIKIRLSMESYHFDKLIIDTANMGKEFAKQVFCKLIDEAEEGII